MPLPDDITGYDVDPGGDAAVYDEWAAIAGDPNQPHPDCRRRDVAAGRTSFDAIAATLTTTQIRAASHPGSILVLAGAGRSLAWACFGATWCFRSLVGARRGLRQGHLRDQIWSRYAIDIQDELRRQILTSGDFRRQGRREIQDGLGHFVAGHKSQRRGDGRLRPRAVEDRE